MILLLFFAVFGLLFWKCVSFRTLFLNPFRSVLYACTDLIKYFKFHKWNNLQTGKIIAYVALFGQGKTLSVVHYVRSLYERYNDKLVYDSFRREWVTQKVHVISNVSLSIPYEDFLSLSQVVNAASYWEQYDLDNGTLTNIIVLGDEFSVQMNSRNFKSNIDPLFLNTLLTCRHHHITLVYDAQRFNHVDALLRQVTSYVVSCHKVWRVLVSDKYDAWEMENCSDPTKLKPLCRYGWFIRDNDFNAYDTLATVGNLEHSCKSGDMLSEAEIIQNQGAVTNVSAPVSIKIQHGRHGKLKVVNN